MKGIKALYSGLLLSPLILLSLPIKSFAVDKSQLSYKKDHRGNTIAIVNSGAIRLSARLNAGKEKRSITPGKTSRMSSQKPSYENEKALSRSFLKETASAFGLKDSHDELSEVNAVQDELGVTHVTYKQMYRGVPIFGSSLVSHINSMGEVLSVNGRTLPNISLDVTPKVSPKKATLNAKRAAFKALNGSLPRSYLKNVKKKCLKKKGDLNKCYRAKIKSLYQKTFEVVETPKLYVFNKEFSGIKGGDSSANLVYEVKLHGPEDKGPSVFIDAKNGRVLHYLTNEGHITRHVYDCALVNPNNPGCRIDYEWFFGGQAFHILGRSEGQPARGAMPAIIGPPYAGSTDVDQAYEHFLPAIHSYFMDRFGRDGANDRGGTGNGTTVPFDVTRMFVHGNGEPTTGMLRCNPGWAWAGATGVAFCAGSLSTAAYDLLGHEYGHVVAQYRSFFQDGSPNALLLVGEAGALNENISDIFGEMFERYMTGSNDWQMFIGSNLASPPFRSLSDPPSIVEPFINLPFPDRFNSPDFYCGTTDSGGIHHNSTVPSKAAYLASVGGSFNGCTIRAIGLDKVEQIWYRAFIHYYAQAETFNGAYNGLRLACADLYSPSDCDELTKALQAVEMDQPGKCSGIPALPPACSQGNACVLTGSFANI